MYVYIYIYIYITYTHTHTHIHIHGAASRTLNIDYSVGTEKVEKLSIWAGAFRQHESMSSSGTSGPTRVYDMAQKQDPGLGFRAGSHILLSVDIRRLSDLCGGGAPCTQRNAREHEAFR